MSSPYRLPIALLLATLLLSGCGNSTQVTDVTSDNQERSEVTAELAQQSEIMEDGVSDNSSEVALAEPGFAAMGDAAIRPLTFFREFRARDRSFSFAFSDSDSTGRPTRALVTVTTRLRGRLHILAVNTDGEREAVRDSARRVIKPFDESRVRRVLLYRVRGANDARVRWRVAACSGAEVSSRGHATEILAVRLQSGDVDVTVTDPLALIRFNSILRLDPTASAQITVTTAANDDVVLLHHAGLRSRLAGNGDNTYSGTLPVGIFLARLRHFGIDAMSRGTLFDDAAPYDSERWVLPFLIAPEVLEDPAPDA